MSNYWQGKRVALLGGASLIGTHLAEALVNTGVSRLVVADDLSAGKDNVELLTRLGIGFMHMDLRDYPNARKAIDKSDIVFHLAAQHGGRGYVSGHKIELYDNLDLDTTIFRACAEAAVEKVVFSSSACAYPIELQQNTEELLYLREDMIDYNRLLPADGAYGTEKLVGEAMLDAYVEAGFFKGVSTRSFTVYGPRMKENHAIAALISKKFIKQNPLEVWGDGHQVRNWTYVEDNVQGALLAAEHLDRGAINIGIEERLTPRIAMKLIHEIMGGEDLEVSFRPFAPIGPRNRVANSSKLFALGWQPKYTFEEGLRKTIDWYLSTHAVEEVRRDFERKLTER